MFTMKYGVHGSLRVSERSYDTLETAKAKALRWSQSNSTGHYWSQVFNSNGQMVSQFN